MRSTSWVYGVLVTLGLGLGLGGCTMMDPEPLGDGPDAAPGASPGVDEASLLSMLPSYARSPGFARLNQDPYVTALPSGDDVNVWVSMNAFAAYSGIQPDASGSGIVAPEGTMLVREVLGADGQVAKLTLMYKGPAGYNPSVGDFWFGVTDANGSPEKMGKLEECYSCHQDRAGDGYLFGVPAAAR